MRIRRIAALIVLGLTALVLLAACGGDEEEAAPATTETEQAAPEGDAAAGATVFADAGCGNCHTLAAAGSSSDQAPNLDEAKPPLDEVVEIVTNGEDGMPAFGEDGTLTEEQIQDVAAYIVESTQG